MAEAFFTVAEDFAGDYVAPYEDTVPCRGCSFPRQPNGFLWCEQGDTPLITAARNNHECCLSAWIESGADVNECHSLVENALHHAAKLGHEQIIKLLLGAGANVNSVNCYLQTPLHLAALAVYPKCVQMLIDAGADVNAKTLEGETALHYAARMGSAACAKILLAARADFNVRNEYGNTEVILAVYQGDPGNTYCLKVLVESGADVNIANKAGETPVNIAVAYRKERFLEVLIAAGADVNIPDATGLTPLISAVQFGRNNLIVPLINAGADVNISDAMGTTPLMNAVECRAYNLIVPLLNAGADLNAKCRAGREVLVFATDTRMAALLLSYGASINTADMSEYAAFLVQSRRSLNMNKKRRDLARFLHAAGQKMPNRRAAAFGLEGCDHKLLHLCREAIRKHLIDLDPHKHLFHRVTQLGLPSLMTEFLVYDETFEDKLQPPEPEPEQVNAPFVDLFGLEPTFNPGVEANFNRLTFNQGDGSTSQAEDLNIGPTFNPGQALTFNPAPETFDPDLYI